MNGARQTWLVADRELRERSKSAAFRISVVLMVLGVAAVIVLPSLITSSGGSKDVGLTGSAPTALAQAIVDQGRAVGTTIRIHPFATLSSGETAVRNGTVNVLVVGAARLEWRRQADEQLKAVVTGAIQLVSVQERAATAGISPANLSALLTPVAVKNAELGQVVGRSRDDETAALVMTVILFLAITVYGTMVMSGVVEEKSSRVVEVLLARMPARNLLAGKITGIGLLGLAQILATALVALVAAATVGSFNVPAVRGAVIAWAVVWFVLGYALFATVFGALGSLASRTEDTQAVAGPVSGLLIIGYFVSFATIGSPTALWARLVSYFPAFAPFAMPNRIAMGGAAWWEPIVAVALTLAAIAGLVAFGGRVYTAAILHTGPTLKLRQAWRATATDAPGAAESTRSAATGRGPSRAEPDLNRRRGTGGRATDVMTTGVIVVVAVALGAAVFAAAHDMIVGLAVAAAFYVVAFRIAKARQHSHH